MLFCFFAVFHKCGNNNPCDIPRLRPGYPDFIQDYTNVNGSRQWTVHITETQKTLARLHTVERPLLQGLLAQHYAAEIPPDEAAVLTPGTHPTN